jgi:hypothetical protein
MIMHLHEPLADRKGRRPDVRARSLGVIGRLRDGARCGTGCRTGTPPVTVCQDAAE